MPNFQKIHDASLKPKQKTSTKQFFKGVVHEQPWSTIVCVVGGFTNVSSCFLSWFFSNIPFTFSFAINIPYAFSFVKAVFLLIHYFLSFFHIKLSEMPNLPKFIQKIFQGGSPWATLIHNSMFVWRVHYCVQLLPEAFFFHSLYLFLCESFFLMVFSMLLLLDFYGSPMGFPWCFYDISGGFLRDFWRDAMGVLWYSYGISIGFLWDLYGISMMVLSYFYGVSIGFLWNFYWIPVGFPRFIYIHDVSIIFLWDCYGNCYGISLWFLCYFHVISMIFLLVFLWSFYWITRGCQLKVSWIQLKVNWNQFKVNWNQFEVNWK